MDELYIVNSKDGIEIDLLKLADDSLPRIIRNLNTCIPFAGIINGRVVAACLLDKKQGYYDIVSLCVEESEQRKGYGREMLTYVMDYVRSQGERYVEIGCPNSNFSLMATYQKLGFRFYGVISDYYMDDTARAVVENSILIRDMVRFRADLNEKRLSTIGYDASGRTT